MFRTARLFAAALLLTTSAPALGQPVTITTPNTVNPAGQPVAVGKTFIVNANGTLATISTSGGGVDNRVAQGSTTAGQTGTLTQCAVVSGNQTYTVGTTNPLNCIATGRLKVAVSNAGNVDPALQLTTTLSADLVAAKYYATRPAWVDGATGVIQADAIGNLYVNNATLPPGAATDATLTAQSAKLPASLGSKAGAASLSVVPNSDTAFPVTGTVAVSGTVPVSGPLTDVQLRQTAVPMGGIFSVNGTLANITTGNRAEMQLDIGGNVRSLMLARSNAVAEGGVVALYAQNRATNTFGTDPLAVLNYTWSGTAVAAARGDTNGSYTVPTPTASASNAIAPNATAAVASGLVAKAAPGNLYSVNIVTGAAAGYLLIFNSTTIPADGAVTPAKCMPIAANTGLETNMRSMPEYFSAGISLAFSTTGCFNKTASATAFFSVDAK